MKKHLIAAAVAAAVAVPAMAQNVEIYGIIDAGYTDSSHKSAANAKVDRGTVQGGTLSTNRLGFRGTEDLGGGLKASFVAEAALGVMNGNTTGAANNAFLSNSNTSGNRQTYVGLSGSFGEIRAGYQYANNHLTRLTGDPSGGANMPGNLAVAVGVAGTTGATTGSTLTNADYEARANQIIYFTPSFSGIRAHVGMSRNTFKNQTTATSTTDTSANGYAIGADYSAGPLKVSFAYADGTTKSSTGGQELDIENMSIAGNYDFGAAVVFASYWKDEKKGNAALGTASDVENKGMQVGVRVPFGATSLIASYSDGDYAAGAPATRLKRDQGGFQVGALHALSKRTTLYALYGEQDRQNTSNTYKTKDEAFAFGVRHSF